MQAVRALGRRPMQVKVSHTTDDRVERALAQRIARHYEELSTEAKCYLDSLQEYQCIREIRVAHAELLQAMSLDSSSLVHCARLSELLRRCQLMIQVQSHAVLRKENRQDGAISEWWKHANICERVTLPSWCLAQDDHRSGTRQRKVVPVWELHYHLSHQLLQDVADFQGGAAQPALSSTPSKSLHADVFARARSQEKTSCAPLS